MVSMIDHHQQQQDNNNRSMPISTISDQQQQQQMATKCPLHHGGKLLGIQTTPESEHGGEDRLQGGDGDPQTRDPQTRDPQTSRDSQSSRDPQTSIDTEPPAAPETRRKTPPPLLSSTACCQGYGPFLQAMGSVAPGPHTPLTQSRNVEQLSPILVPSDCERKFERKKLQPNQISKTNAQYHKLFKELSQDELLKQSYTCALQKDILYQGKLFVSDNWICFHSKVFGRDTKIAIPVRSVTLIKKTKTAILVPNALVISTTCERHVFVSFLSRDTTYKLLKSICVHLDGNNNPESCSLNVSSSCENSFMETCHSALPLDFPSDLCDLEAVVHQRRGDLLESSSSGSQTPDYDKMADFAGLQDQFLSTMKNGEMSVHADVHLHTPNHNGPVKTTHKDKSAQPMSLHTLLLIYLFLVSVLLVSSCYMAFKIVALEQRLNSLVSMGENVVRHRSQADFNAQMYGELSSNLFKLEKVQRNLRKLLGET